MAGTLLTACRTAAPKILQIHGTADPIVPYAGGFSSFTGVTFPAVGSARDGVLAGHPDAVFDVITVPGGGHTWPTPGSGGIDPADVLWTFLRGRALPNPRSVPGVDVFASPATGSHEVHGAILDRYLAMGGPTGPLGLPTSDERTVRGGRASDFSGGTIYWSSAAGTHVVQGRILDYYRRTGESSSWLRLPVSDEYPIPGGRASDSSGGRVVWSPATGAHASWGAIGEFWTGRGGSASFLGFPTSDEADVPGVPGARVVAFQGSVFWGPGTRAHEVHGAILGRYLAAGGPALLELPIGDEAAAADRAGRVSRFTNAAIYWSAGTGAHEVHGAIRDLWSVLGAEAGVLGYPTSDEVSGPTGSRLSTFARGRIYWSAATGAHEVHGAILDRYLAVGGPAGALGLPTSGEYAVPGGRRSTFTAGSITWLAATGQTTVTP